MKQRYRIRLGSWFRFRVQQEMSFFGLFKFWRTVYSTNYEELALDAIKVARGELVD